jgi:hypothetical protein
MWKILSPVETLPGVEHEETADVPIGQGSELWPPWAGPCVQVLHAFGRLPVAQ